MAGWKFISNHGLVLNYIARNPRGTARQIADAVGVTERTAHKIIAELEQDGYLIRRKQGRRNIYRVNRYMTLRHHAFRDTVVGDLLTLLSPPRRRATRAAEREVARSA